MSSATGRSRDGDEALATEPDRPAEHGVSAFMTDRVDRVARAPGRRRGSPTPATGGRTRLMRRRVTGRRPTHPDDIDLPVPAPDREIPFCGRLMDPAPADEQAMRELRAQYYGMVSDVDHELGRLFDAITSMGMWDDTFVVDHLGPRRAAREPGACWARAACSSPATTSSGSCAIRESPINTGRSSSGSPRTSTSSRRSAKPWASMFPRSATGSRSRPSWTATQPEWWRDEAHWEYDWRWEYIPFGPHPWPWDRRLETKHLTVSRSDQYAYVQFDEGDWRCFDLARDPTWRTEVSDSDVVLERAQAMLTWRSRLADRTLSDMLVIGGGMGRIPQVDHMTLAELIELLTGMEQAPGEADGLSELDHGLQCAYELSCARPDDAELQVAGLGPRHRPPVRVRRAARRARRRARPGGARGPGGRPRRDARARQALSRRDGSRPTSPF